MGRCGGVSAYYLRYIDVTFSSLFLNLRTAMANVALSLFSNHYLNAANVSGSMRSDALAARRTRTCTAHTHCAGSTAITLDGTDTHS